MNTNTARNITIYRTAWVDGARTDTTFHRGTHTVEMRRVLGGRGHQGLDEPIIQQLSPEDFAALESCIAKRSVEREDL